MKVLQATTARGWSGGTEQCLLLAKYMNRFGVKTDILCFKGTELERRAKELGIGVRYFPNTRKFSLSEAKELGKILSEYDVVNTHISKAHWFVWSALFFASKRPVLVYTRRVPYPISKVSLLTKYNLFTDRIVAVSPGIYEELRSVPFIRKKVRYIPSGVELDRFSPAVESSLREELGLDGEALLFTNVGNFSEVKGHHVLLPAFKEFLSVTGLENAYLLLVGRDTDSEALRLKVRELGLEGRVVPLGFRRDVPQILKATDVFVFPSLNEGIAGSLLQAMAMEKVVVASYVGGIRSYLKHMENGIAVTPGSVESLVEGMVLAVDNLGNESLKREAGKTARKFDIKRVAEETLKLYGEILNG